MRHPLVFAILALMVLCAAGLALYFFGLPMLAENSISCRTGGGGLGKSLGCSSSFGKFAGTLAAVAVLLLVGIWNWLKGID